MAAAAGPILDFPRVAIAHSNPGRIVTRAELESHGLVAPPEEYASVPPDAESESGIIERLVQRVLRESGFTQLEVTGRTGDGGIDGRGIARIAGLMSFHVLFQCKRYKGSVSAGEMRDFRGAMMGRTDKGLFITTGTFTPAAVREATRDGAPPIDLLDGNEFAEKLKELSLGVTTETVQVYTVDETWFANI